MRRLPGLLPVGLLVVIVVSVLWPIGFVLVDVARGLASEGLPAGVASASVWRRLAWTLCVAGLIGAGAVLLAWPVAWAMRQRPWRWAPVAVVPMLLPSYLAYTGWGLVRAPGTVFGDWLARGPVWRIRAFEHVLALGGLAMWAWPIAAVVLVVGFRRIWPEVLEAMRVDGAGLWVRNCAVARMALGYIAGAWGLVALVMVGSAVPLHVGQVETFTIEVWLRLAQTGPGDWWRAWVSAWPVLVIALVGALVFSGRAMRAGSVGFLCEDTAVRSTRVWWLAVCVWAASVAVPALLLAWSLREWGSIRGFVRVHDEAFVRSAVVASAAGLLCGVIAALVSLVSSAGGHRARVASLAVRILVLAGLTPGVLIGVALSKGWESAGDWARWIFDSPSIVVLGDVARFGFVGGLMGWWLAVSESTDLHLMRRMDGAEGFGGWLRACLPWQAGGLLGSGLACMALSLHEIEASIMLEPPGHEGLARLMLGMLHFARMEELSAGTLVVVGVTAVVAIAVAGVMAWLGLAAGGVRRSAGDRVGME